MLTLGLPAAAVFAALSLEVTTLLFRGGSFDASSTSDVAYVLSFYALGLPANAASRVVAVGSFALGDTASPARFAIVRVVVSTAIAVVAMRTIGVAGIVLGAAIAAWLELGLLVNRVGARVGGVGLEHVPIARILVLAGVTAGAGFAMRYATRSFDLQAIVSAAVILSVSGLAFVICLPTLKLLSLRSLLKR